ncbi:MAG: hypothetical protein J7604_01330 [Sporocytophaga sp.]|uniref:hypothetical protein n=1 Tax=Sporocytophaga sp. TaxID=2231183 RepID=UPI001B1EF334|nr:hypothetical protein [Sporocytophaga sp.]MBO9698815.1 hypothetical protein [Sporocytophaga sp.]
MKKVFVLVLFAVFGTYVVNAQDDSEQEMKKEKTEVKSDGTVNDDDGVVTAKNENEHKAYEDRTRAGQTVDNVGHGTVQGIRGAGKGVGNAASWTWENTKHNKVTKKIFDQPENAEERQLKVNKKAMKKEQKRTEKEGLNESKTYQDDQNTGEEAKRDVQKGAEETKEGVQKGAEETGDAASTAWDKTKHNKATKEVFDQPGDVDQKDKDKKDKDKRGASSKTTQTEVKTKDGKTTTKQKKTKVDDEGNATVKKKKETSSSN